MQNRKKRFYLIGIAGVAMASLAGLLKKRGYQVAGSDQQMYPPMSDMLNSLNIPVFSPYSEFHMKQYKPDVVVVGNAIGRGNPELEYMISIGQSYRSLPEILRDEFIESKKSIVITGTHGKTTTSALVAWILECAGLDPTVFVGGFMKNFDSSFKLGKGEYVVLEGDEYDTAFYDKGPKFWHYRPHIGLVNNIELDHVDIYKDLEAIKFSFARFINLIPKNGLLVVNKDDKNSFDLGKKWAKSPIFSFGLRNNPDISVKNIDFSPKKTCFSLVGKERRENRIESGLSGTFNVSNILGAVAIAQHLKIPMATIKKAIATFEGVKRRSEVIGEKNGITVINDYAHHPTAVRETLESIKQRFHGSRIVSVFEPGSASSKRKVFQNEYIKSLAKSDISYIYKPFHVEHLDKREVFSGSSVSRSIKKLGVLSKYFEDMKNLLFHMKQNLKHGDVVVIMSCRGFDGLPSEVLKII